VSKVWATGGLHAIWHFAFLLVLRAFLPCKKAFSVSRKKYCGRRQSQFFIKERVSWNGNNFDAFETEQALN
jgi:hypothetical protein